MQSLSFREHLFSTTNTKFAAVLLLFGFRLNHPDKALEATLEYASKDLFLKSRKDPSIKPKKQVAWNFIPGPGINEIFAAYSGDNAEQRFQAVLDKLLALPEAIAADVQGRLEKNRAVLAERQLRPKRPTFDDAMALVKEHLEKGEEGYVVLPNPTAGEGDELDAEELEPEGDIWRRVTDEHVRAIKAEIQSCSSALIAEQSRRVLEAREYLISILKRVPPLGWLVVVFGRGRTFAKFGQNASKETIAEHLKNI